MAQERLVAVSYPADDEFAQVNAEILGGDAALVYTHELGEEVRDQALRDAEALLAWDLPKEVPAGALRESTRLRIVQLLSAGVDDVDFAAVPESLIVASNAGAYAGAVAEHAVAMVLSLAKHLPERHAALAAGRFDKWAPSLALEGATCAILGFGGIGRAAARLLRAFGARIHAVNRTGRTSEAVDYITTLANLDLVLATADVVVISLPLTLATRGLIGRNEFAVMRPGAVFVNVARGPIVDQQALYEHLCANPDFRAGIDTWWGEPQGDEPFRADYPFVELPNVIGSPHNSSVVPGTMLAGARAAAENVRRYLRGEPVRGVVRRADYVAGG
jgi:phosphoglycerate dehydrogenase-like enzyme